MEEYFDGHYSIFKFEIDSYRKIYNEISRQWGERDEYDATLFRATWYKSSDKYSQIALHLYEYQVEVFIDIPTSPEGLSSSSITDFDSPSEAEEMEASILRYRSSRSESEKRANRILHSRKADIQKLRHEQLNAELELESVKSKGAQKLLENLESQRIKEARRLKKIKKDIEFENQLIETANSLKLLQVENKKKEQELAAAIGKRKSRDLQKRQGIAGSTLPAGYDYNANFYKKELSRLRGLYGADTEIEQRVGKRMLQYYPGKKNYARVLAKTYVDFYKVKYEGVTIKSGFDKPKRTSKSLEEHSSISGDMVGLALVLFAVMAFFYGCGWLIAPDGGNIFG